MASSKSSSSRHHSDRRRREKRNRHDDENENDSGSSDGGGRRSNSSKKMKKKKRDDINDLTRNKRDHSRDNHSDIDDNYVDDSRDSKHYKDNHHRGSRSRSSRDRHSSTSNRRHRRREDSDKKRKKSHRDDYDDHSDDDRSRDRKKKSKKSKSKRKDKHIKTSLKPDKSKLFPMGEPLGTKPDSIINADQDYFNYHQEFWVYLYREEGKCFNDIDNKDSHAAFARFCELYNSGKLEEPYYKRKFPHEVIEESKTTKHSWAFKTTHGERKGLDDLQKGVRKQTEYSSSTNTNTNTNINSNTNNSIDSGSGINAKNQKAKAIPSVQHRPTVEERLEDRRANRRLKETVRLTHEELTGGSKDIRERQLEKKRDNAARIHGAHREKEEGGGGLELSDGVLYGDVKEQNSFSRERRNKERREEHRKNRIDELQSKEEDRKNNMLKLLGLDNLQGQGRLKIAPRKDSPSNI
jgi:hypothetical protein